MMPPTFWVLLAIGLQQVPEISAQDPCIAEAYLYKKHIWNSGYVAVLYLDQNKLPMSTLSWTEDITFYNELNEFKIWDANIQGTSKNYVRNVTQVVVDNKCWNPILYPCQFLELSFLVRHDFCPSPCTDYDIKNVVESAVLSNEDASMSPFMINFDTICPGQPTSPPTATTVAG